MPSGMAARRKLPVSGQTKPNTPRDLDLKQDAQSHTRYLPASASLELFRSGPGLFGTRCTKEAVVKYRP